MKSAFFTVLGCLLLVSGPVTHGYAQANILIVYHSKTGNTEQMARAVYEGATSVEGVVVALKTIEQATIPDILDADAIILGSPVYNANVTPEVQAFISGWPFEDTPLRDKLGAAFVTAGGISAGEEITQMNILQSMLIFGMVVMGGDDWLSPFGASAVVSEPPFDEQQAVAPQFLEKGVNLGRRVAAMAAKMNHTGR